MDKYHPDLYYTDGGIPFKQAGLNVLAHFYNENQKWNNGKLQAVATIKLDWTPNVAVNNYEFGYPADRPALPLAVGQDDGRDWYWIRNATARYMSAQHAIHMLIDTVSKNGNLLLNVPLTPDGELEPETIAMLNEMGRCLDIIGEAVFSTRCWVVANDGDGGIRFTRNKENTVLYVMNLGWSNDELRIRTLGSSRIDLNTLTSVSLLGAPGNLTYQPGRRGTVDQSPQGALRLARVCVQADVHRPDSEAQAITHPNSRAGLIGANLRTLVAPRLYQAAPGRAFKRDGFRVVVAAE